MESQGSSSSPIYGDESEAKDTAISEMIGGVARHAPKCRVAAKAAMSFRIVRLKTALPSRSPPFASWLEKRMHSYADTRNGGHNGHETRIVVELRSSRGFLDKGSAVNGLGSGPKPIGLRIDFEKE